VKTIHIHSWAEFLDQVSRLDQWAFRGQPRADLPLLSSLSRRLMRFSGNQQLWPLLERRTLRIFRRKAHVHVTDPNLLQNDLRCLAMMQHHGGATRLLDFTKSPFVAAFFALESAYNDSVVYALNTPALWHRVPRFDTALTRQTIDPRVPHNFDKYFFDNHLPLIWFGEPSEMDQRLIAQSGLFVVPGQLDKTLDELLASYSAQGESLLVQLVMDKSVRQEAMKELYRMNITYATLWPDIDGLSRSMNQELEIIWQPLVDEFL
jgi:hypothetical protein